MSSKPGRKRGGLRGDYAELRALAGVLRDVADSHGLTLRDLEERMPYARTSISSRLSGDSRPEWKFVTLFLTACAGDDREAAAVLERKVRPLWEAAAPSRALRTAPVPVDRIPGDIGIWVTAMRETAAAQQVVARLQLSASRNISTVQGLLIMIAKLTSAAQTLTGERDELRQQLLTSADAANELLRTRALLDDTQHRLDAAERLLAQTGRRLDEAMRQREEAQRLSQVAITRARESKQRLAQIEQQAIAFADSIRAEARPVADDTTLMDGMDQQLAADILRRVDDALGVEASALDQLQGELAFAPSDNGKLSGGQPPAAPEREAARSATPILQRLARRQIDHASQFVRQLPHGVGEIAYDGEDRDWLLDLTREAEFSIDAISLSTVDGGTRGFDAGLWSSDLGVRYLELQHKATARHVRIRRLFIFESVDLGQDESFLNIIRTQRAAGIEVRKLDDPLIPEWMRSMISDFIIFDGAVSYETISAENFPAGQLRPTVIRTVLSSAPAKVREFQTFFEELWAVASPDP